MTIALLICIAVLLMSLGAERLHARRVGELGRLAFGRNREASALASMAPVFRSLAMAAMAWGMMMLLVTPPSQRLRDPNAATNIDPKELRRILIVLDVSPSMRIKDAAGGTLTRAQRAADVLMNMISRVDFDKARVTIAAFYTGVKPVVIDAVDPAVVRQVVFNNSLDQAFEDGETDLGVAFRGGYQLAKDWRPDSTTLIVVTDGDTSPIGVLPAKPASIARSLFLGVGDADKGTFIDNHISRQNTIELQNLAGQLGGFYADADGKFVPTDLLSDLSGLIKSAPPQGTGQREYALASIAIGSMVLCGLPGLLTFWGTRIKPPAVEVAPSKNLAGAAR